MLNTCLKHCMNKNENTENIRHILQSRVFTKPPQTDAAAQLSLLLLVLPV